MGNPFELVDAQDRIPVLLPPVKGGLADSAQEFALFLDGQVPDFPNPEKRTNARTGKAFQVRPTSEGVEVLNRTNYHMTPQS
jgi:hypothetical protein